MKPSNSQIIFHTFHTQVNTCIVNSNYIMKVEDDKSGNWMGEMVNLLKFGLILN
jgi:hypothetical protein